MKCGGRCEQRQDGLNEWSDHVEFTWYRALAVTRTSLAATRLAGYGLACLTSKWSQGESINCLKRSCHYVQPALTVSQHLAATVYLYVCFVPKTAVTQQCCNELTLCFLWGRERICKYLDEICALKDRVIAGNHSYLIRHISVSKTE